MGQSIARNQKTSFNWKMGIPIITKKYLSLQNLLYLGKLSRDVLTRIFNKKKFCQINFCEYRSFIFRKTLNFYYICRNIGLQHAQLLRMTKSKKITCINFRVWAKLFVSQDKLSKIAPKFEKFVKFFLAKVFKEN